MKQELITKERINQHAGTDFHKYRKALLMMARKWYVYLIAIVIAFVCAYLLLEYKYPSYRAETTVLIEEEDRTAGQDMLEGFTMRPGVRNLDNQILIISSHTMISKVIDELSFETDVYKKGLLSKVSFYPRSPIKIEAGPTGLPYNVEFAFQYTGDDQFNLTLPSNSTTELDTVISFGENFEFNGGSFTVFPSLENEEEFMNGDKIYFQFYNKERLTNSYASRLQVEQVSADGSIVSLALEGTNRYKDLIFLDKLVEIFIGNNLEKKNLEAKRIIDFIEAQLVDVEDSLIVTETQLQEFRSRNRIMDVSAQTQQIIDQAVILENEKARLNLNRSYYVYLDEYLSEESNENRPISPASMGITDQLLTSLIQELSELQAEYYTSGVGERNPLQGQLELRIKNAKESIKETLSGIMLANDMAVEENEKQIRNLNVQASNLPEKEQQLLGFERRFNLNNVLYTFLLQRRAEAQIQKASNAPDHELVDPAKSIGPISPIPQKVYAIALSLALVLPTLLLYLLTNILHFKITSEEDLNLVSDLPVIAQFPHSRLNFYTVVLTEPDSIVAEAFRSLRTRMEFFTKEVECPVIVVSSSIPGEGKTFTAINLASIYSLMDMKTLLVGFDLRRPTLSKSFENEDKHGITDYLIGRKKLNEVIHQSVYENLDIIHPGPIPPNPAELLSTEKAKEVFSILREKYDCIIVDSPPVGVVSDIYPIAGIADAMLIVVRHGYTRRNALRTTLSDLEAYHVRGLGLLVNGVKSITNNYRYNYKYKYTYKIPAKEKDTKKTFADRLKRKGKA